MDRGRRANLALAGILSLLLVGVVVWTTLALREGSGDGFVDWSSAWSAGQMVGLIAAPSYAVLALSCLQLPHRFYPPRLSSWVVAMGLQILAFVAFAGSAFAFMVAMDEAGEGVQEMEYLALFLVLLASALLIGAYAQVRGSRHPRNDTDAAMLLAPRAGQQPDGRVFAAIMGGILVLGMVMILFSGLGGQSGLFEGPDPAEVTMERQFDMQLSGSSFQGLSQGGLNGNPTDIESISLFDGPVGSFRASITHEGTTTGVTYTIRLVDAQTDEVIKSLTTSATGEKLFQVQDAPEQLRIEVALENSSTDQLTLHVLLTGYRGTGQA